MPSPKFEAILFDLDGTLVDTSQYIMQSFNHMLALHGKPLLTLKQVAAFAGKRLQECAPVLGFREDQTEQVIKEYLDFQTSHNELIVPFAKTDEVLKTLRAHGIKIGVVTARGRKSAELVLAKTGLDKLIDVLNCGTDGFTAKPSPDMLFDCAAKLSVKPNDCLLVGDGCVDLQAAKNAGMKSARALWGYGALEDCAVESSFQLRSIDDVLSVVGVAKHGESL